MLKQKSLLDKKAIFFLQRWHLSEAPFLCEHQKERKELSTFHTFTPELGFLKTVTTFLACFRGERRNTRRKESLPQLGIQLTTTRS